MVIVLVTYIYIFFHYMGAYNFFRIVISLVFFGLMTFNMILYYERYFILKKYEGKAKSVKFLARYKIEYDVNDPFISEKDKKTLADNKEATKNTAVFILFIIIVSSIMLYFL